MAMNERLAVAWLMYAGLAAAAPVDLQESLYRTDLPAVVTSPQGAGQLTLQELAAFQEAYRRAKRPRMLVFWNRELTDSTYQKGIKTTVQATVTQKDGRLEEVLPGEYELSASRTTARVTREIVDRVPEPARTTVPHERLDAQIQTGFMTRLIEARVRLVDRSLPLRYLASAAKAPQDLDSQTLEMNALAKYADWLMEVVSIPDAESKTAWGLRISIKRVADGEVLVSHYVAGDDTRELTRYATDPELGIKRLAPKARDFGALAAVQVLNQLAGSSSR